MSEAGRAAGRAGGRVCAWGRERVPVATAGGPEPGGGQRETRGYRPPPPRRRRARAARTYARTRGRVQRARLIATVGAEARGRWPVAGRPAPGSPAEGPRADQQEGAQPQQPPQLGPGAAARGMKRGRAGAAGARRRRRPSRPEAAVALRRRRRPTAAGCR